MVTRGVIRCILYHCIRSDKTFIIQSQTLPLRNASRLILIYGYLLPFHFISSSLRGLSQQHQSCTDGRMLMHLRKSAMCEQLSGLLALTALEVARAIWSSSRSTMSIPTPHFHLLRPNVISPPESQLRISTAQSSPLALERSCCIFLTGARQRCPRSIFLA